MHLNDTTTICHCYLELVTINVDRFAAGRQMAEGLHHQPANGIHFFIAKVRVEGVVEVFDGGQGAHRPGMAAQLAEIDIFFFVVLVFNFPDDELKDILDGHQTGDAAEFVNNDRHMVAL